MVELREKYVETNGIRLHVMESGPKEGPVIFFLHGFPEFWYAWRKQIEFFSTRGYLTVAPDQRGYNLSDKPSGVAPYRVDELARDIIGLMDHYGREKFFLVGHDWGGAVSWWIALKYPERLKKLVIMNCSHPLVYRKHLLGNQRQMEKSWYVFYFQLPGLVEKFAAADNFSWPVRLLVETSRPGTFSEEELERYREAFQQPGAFSAMVNWYRATFQAKSEPPADFRVKVPTLILWGMNDVAFVPEQADESLAFCDNGRLVKFPESSHWIEHEEAEKINPLMLEFFEEA
ncbi:MAG: alpha/beta hydrolase [Syntrophales bacterium]|nr:alpha/beta hydrolase [Syntrophales bacterium]